jgi:hypothetical protein
MKTVARSAATRTVRATPGMRLNLAILTMVPGQVGGPKRWTARGRARQMAYVVCQADGVLEEGAGNGRLTRTVVPRPGAE